MARCRRARLLAGCMSALLLNPHAAAAQQPSAAATASAPAQAPAPVQTLPLPNRLNEILPAWLHVRAEARERMEGFDGGGFDDGRQDLYWLTRVRLHATVTASPHLAFQAQVQDARVARKSVGPTGAPFHAPFDLRMAFTDIGSSTSRVALRLGRQELVYGEQRLVGHVGWLNAARTFDAAKATFRAPAFSLDVFGASVVRSLPDAFDRSGNGNRFAGAYATTTRLVPSAAVEPYVFWKRDVRQAGELGTLDDLQHTTVGVRLAGKLPARLDYGVEVALQRGTLGAEEVRAWAGHWQLRESLPLPGALTLTAEYNFASGDTDPADGVRGTFDQLYPTPHDKTGLADQIGWKNIHHARAGFGVTPLSGLPVTVNYHSWWLASATDAAYAVNNAVIARIPTGAADRHVGQEVDVQVTRAVTPQLQVAAGYAHVRPGAFLAQTTPGASYSHPYVMATYVFLAER